MATGNMLDQVKSAMLKCANKSQELEDASNQLTVQKLRSQLSLETRIKKVVEQVKESGQQLLAELAIQHERGLAKIQEQQLMVLKHNMELSSAMVKEVANDELCKKVEEFTARGTSGLQVLFVPASNLENVSTSFLGFIQVSRHHPADLELSLSSSLLIDETKVMTCSVSSLIQGELEEVRKLLTVVVRRNQEVVPIEFEMKVTESTFPCLNIQFVVKWSGRYCVEARLYGVHVKGSPLVMKVDGGSVSQEIGQESACTKDGVKDCEVTLDENIVMKNMGEGIEEAELDVKLEINTVLNNNGKNYKEDIGQEFPKEAKDDLLLKSKGLVNESLVAAVANTVEEAGVKVVNISESMREALESESMVPVSEELDVAEPSTVSVMPVFPIGSTCLARWREDKIWYRAKVDSFDQGEYGVTFVDYGNTVLVKEEEMVHTAADIPSAEVELVDAMVWKWSVGMSVIVKWSEDSVWYNGVVESVVGGQYNVLFVDYGNTEVVAENDIVETYNEIPAEELENVDLCVARAVEPPGTGNIIDIKDVSSDSVPPVVKDIPDIAMEACGEQAEVENAQIETNTVCPDVGNFSVGSVCLAEWNEDNTWYNSLVKEVNTDGSYTVVFQDYGNESTVTEDKMVVNVEEIPVGANIDELVRYKIIGVPNQAGTGEGDTKDMNNVSDGGNGENQRSDGVGVEKDVDTKNTSNVRSVHAKQVSSERSPDEVMEPKDLDGHGEEAWVPSVGSVCCAKWSDRVWYNARVDELLKGGKEVVVTFTDYGNTDRVPIRKLVKNREMIPKGAKINTFVEQGEIQIDLRDGLAEGDECVALWGQDNTWYNAFIIKVDKEMVEVEFVDYGNVDLVSVNDVYRNISHVLLDRQSEAPSEMIVDPNVDMGGIAEVDPAAPVPLLQNVVGAEEEQVSHVQGVDPPVPLIHVMQTLNLRSLVNTDQNGKVILNAIVVNIIPCMESVVGMVMVQGVLVTVSATENSVTMWSRDGGLIGSVEGGSSFKAPYNVVALEGLGFAVLDKQGIHMFNFKGQFVKTLIVDKLDTCRGLVVDNMNRMVVINRCFPRDGDLGILTAPGQTDILYIDLDKEKVVKRVEMIDILEDTDKSDCKALAIHKDKLYVVDSGLDCIYTLFHEDGEDQAEMFGSSGRGEGQFAGVADVVVDDEGTIVISDTRNNRLQLVGSDWEFIGFVKVQPTPLSRPACMCLDKETKQLVVFNTGSKEIVRYVLEKNS